MYGIYKVVFLFPGYRDEYNIHLSSHKVFPWERWQGMFGWIMIPAGEWGENCQGRRSSYVGIVTVYFMYRKGIFVKV